MASAEKLRKVEGAYMVEVQHMPIWDRLTEEEFPPEPPIPAPCCRTCGRKYAIEMGTVYGVILSCGYCYRHRLNESSVGA